MKGLIIVDGYNVIFANKKLKNLSNISLELARKELIDILVDYSIYAIKDIIIVFDAYKIDNTKNIVEKHGNIDVIYTSKGITADALIEKLVLSYGKLKKIEVVTNDNLQQKSILMSGATRLSVKDLFKEIFVRKEEMNIDYKYKEYLLDFADDELREELEKIRLNKKE